LTQRKEIPFAWGMEYTFTQ